VVVFPSPGLKRSPPKENPRQSHDVLIKPMKIRTAQIEIEARRFGRLGRTKSTAITTWSPTTTVSKSDNSVKAKNLPKHKSPNRQVKIRLLVYPRIPMKLRGVRDGLQVAMTMRLARGPRRDLTNSPRVAGVLNGLMDPPTLSDLIPACTANASSATNPYYYPTTNAG